MKKHLSIHFLIALAVIFTSCGTGNDVVSNRLISKRKHTKGFFINKKGNQKASKSEKEKESVAFESSKSERKPYTKSLKSSENKSNKETETVAEAVSFESEKVTNESSSQRAERTLVGEDNLRDGAFVEESFENDFDDESGEDVKKDQKKTKVAVKSKKGNAANSDVMTILLVILALFIAPLAVGIYEGITTRFWITLILWLVGIGLGFWLLGPAIAWLAGLVAAIYAILIVLGVI